MRRRCDGKPIGLYTSDRQRWSGIPTSSCIHETKEDKGNTNELGPSMTSF